MAPAMMSCPKSLELSPASLSNGTTTPSAVATRIIAMSSGDMTCPAANSPYPTSNARPNEARKARLTYSNRRPRKRSSSTSKPARKSRKASPNTERIEIGRSTLTQPRTDGPMMMPTTISTTTEGRRRAGERPSRSGARNATMATMSNPTNETSGMISSHPQDNCDR